MNVLQKNKKDVTGLLVFGTLALGFGFGVYYLLPLSLISFNFSMATLIYLVILFGMIMAMTILAINFMYLLNKLLANLFLFFEKTSTRLLV